MALSSGSPVKMPGQTERVVTQRSQDKNQKLTDKAVLDQLNSPSNEWNREMTKTTLLRSNTEAGAHAWHSAFERPTCLLKSWGTISRGTPLVSLMQAQMNTKPKRDELPKKYSVNLMLVSTMMGDAM